MSKLIAAIPPGMGKTTLAMSNKEVLDFDVGVLREMIFGKGPVNTKYLGVAYDTMSRTLNSLLSLVTSKVVMIDEPEVYSDLLSSHDQHGPRFDSIIILPTAEFFFNRLIPALRRRETGRDMTFVNQYAKSWLGRNWINGWLRLPGSKIIVDDFIIDKVINYLMRHGIEALRKTPLAFVNGTVTSIPLSKLRVYAGLSISSDILQTYISKALGLNSKDESEKIPNNMNINEKEAFI